jgi:hypothetical protein
MIGQIFIGRGTVYTKHYCTFYWEELRKYSNYAIAWLVGFDSHHGNITACRLALELIRVSLLWLLEFFIAGKVNSYSKTTILFCPVAQHTKSGPRPPIVEVSVSNKIRYTCTVGLLWTSDQPDTQTLPENTQHSQERVIHAHGRIRTIDRSNQAAADLRLRSRGHRVGQNHMKHLLGYKFV